YTEPVTINTAGGTPSLALIIGSTPRNAAYLSGGGTAALLFRYTVQAGDNDADGLATTSLMILNGGTIRDAAGNDAGLTFTPPSIAGVLVDTTAPGITSAATASGTYGS